ncbi:proline-specific peptidase [Armillaria gallica]|uniref:Proline-specific peptidase n=1 Tax=Armillaria gallica TaxID=47427 RepID=A0A2H3DC32_ARMGA|nr:proline-specific peptidase [Armillaria gallica]
MLLKTTGTANFKVRGETYQTWYKVIGDLKTGKTPLVTLRGGPGFAREYMLVHKALTESAGYVSFMLTYWERNLPDAPKRILDARTFMDELDNLCNHLGISECFDLAAQSWGGMLAGQYAATRAPKGLRRLVILNSPASIELYEVGTDALSEKFPPDFVAMLRKHEQEGTTSSKEYEGGMMVFMKKHVCTLDPWPEDVMFSFSFDLVCLDLRALPRLGPSEFNVTGIFKTWSIIDVLHKITYPTLIVSAPNDEVQDVAVMPWFLKVPKIKWLELSNSTHLGLYEEMDRYLRVLRQFLEVSD